MMHSYVRAGIYFRTIPGFIYPRPPVISHPTGTVVPAVWDTPQSLMPVNRLVSNMHSHSHTPPQQLFAVGDWVIATRGLYRSDVGCIVDPDPFKFNLEPLQFLVAFLPRLKAPEAKKRKVTSTSSPRTPFPQSSTAAGTVMSRYKAAHNYTTSIEGFPIPLEISTSRKRKLPSSPRRSAKTPIAPASVETFARTHSFPISQMKCGHCHTPSTCAHRDKVYKIFNQYIASEGFALVVLKCTHIRPAKVMLSNDLVHWLHTAPTLINNRLPLPSTWCFEPGDRVRSSPYILSDDLDLGQMPIGAEGIIENVSDNGCEVALINNDEESQIMESATIIPRSLKLIPHRHLLKVFNKGDRAMTLGQTTIEGLVVGVGEGSAGVGDAISLIVDNDNDIRQFHPNCLRNLTLRPRIEAGRPLPYTTHDEIVSSSRDLMQTGSSGDPSTGRAPWLGTAVKVVGTGSRNHPQLHKGEVGIVKDVKISTQNQSGIAILVRFDAPSTAGDQWFDFDRIRHRETDDYLHDAPARSHFQFKPGYKKNYSPTIADKGKGILIEPMDNTAKERQEREDLEKAASEQVAIQGNNSTSPERFVRTGVPIELRAGTPPPSTDWIFDPEITKNLPRQQVLVALRGHAEDVEVEIRQGEEMIEVVHWIKPKNAAKRAQEITAQNLDPFLCSHAAQGSFSNKLFLVCHGTNAGRIGRALDYGVDGTLLLKPVRHEQIHKEKARKLHFREVAVDGPLFRVAMTSCATVPMPAEEDREAKKSLNLEQWTRVFELHELGYQLSDEQKLILGEIPPRITTLY